MTDKELKKLSRLELLELLLVKSHENQRLKDELEKIKMENTVGKSVEQLNETSGQLQAALGQMCSLMEQMNQPAGESDTPRKPKETTAATTKIAVSPKAPNVDAAIYKSMLVYFAKNPKALSLLPDELRERVEARLIEIKEKRKPQ